MLQCGLLNLEVNIFLNVCCDLLNLERNINFNGSNIILVFGMIVIKANLSNFNFKIISWLSKI